MATSAVADVEVLVLLRSLPNLLGIFRILATPVLVWLVLQNTSSGYYGAIALLLLMAASDIIITKAGPGTLMEALVMRRPVIVTEAVGMQERGNIDFVLNHELGAYCPTPNRIIPALDELIDPHTYAATVARLADAVPRDGAMQIAQLLLEQSRLAPPSRKRRLRLPSMAELRQISTERLHRPAALARVRFGSRARRLRLQSIRRLPRWRRSR